MRVLVTGASGFVAPHVIAALVARGDEVFASAKDPERIPTGAGITPVPLDLSQPFTAEQLPPVDAVIHLAQANVPFPEHALDLYNVNTVSTVRLLDACRALGARQFVHASSGTVYGLADHAFNESDPVSHHQFYATTKIHAEDAVRGFAGELEGAVSLRIFAPYGPGQVRRMIPGIIARVRDGEAVTLNGGGRPAMNPLYVADLVRAILKGLSHRGHLIVNAAGPDVVSIREMAEAAGRALGREPVFIETENPAGDVIADTTAFTAWLGEEGLTSFEEGMRLTAPTVV